MQSLNWTSLRMLFFKQAQESETYDYETARELASAVEHKLKQTS